MGSGGVRPQRRDVSARALRADGAPRLYGSEDRRQRLTQLKLLAFTPIGAEPFRRELPPGLADLFTIEVVDWPDGTVASLVEFASTLVDDDTVLFGHSMNATLVLAVAAQTTCRGVVAVAPATQLPPDRDATLAFWESNAEPERKRQAAALRAEFDTADDADKPMLYVRYNNLRYFYDLDHPLPTPKEMTVAGDWSQRVMGSGPDLDWSATFDAVTSPVFLALGDHDFLAPPTLWLDAPRRPGWTIEVFERSGHSPYEDHPEAFVAATDRWLASL